MTTIAFDGKQIAADRQWTQGDTPIYKPKLRRLEWRGEPAIVGAAGLVEHWWPVVEWLCHGGDMPDISEKSNFSVLVVTKSKQVWYADESLFFNDMNKSPWAIGTGSDYALGAMAAGKSAAEAVEIAATLDINTGGGVDSFILARI